MFIGHGATFADKKTIGNPDEKKICCFRIQPVDINFIGNGALPLKMNEIFAHISIPVLEQLLALSPMATAMFRENQLVWRNQAAATLFGDMGSDSITSEVLAKKLIPNPLIRETLLARARAQGAERGDDVPRPIPVELRRSDGQLIQCEMSLIRVDVYTLLFVNLPGSFQYTNEILSETHKMAALGRLAQGMAHEINNPLAAIGQNMQLILQRLIMNTERNRQIAEECGTSIDAIEKYITAQGISEKFDAVLTQNIRAGKIIHQMMAFAPNDQSHQYLPQSIAELVEHSLYLARRDYFQHTALEFANIGLNISIEKNLPDVVCQAWKITQAFFAVIKNATEAIHKKFTASKGGQIDIRAWREGKLVRISFEDNGVGMKAELLDKIFEPYFTTKSGNLGTGLGLASCYYVINHEHFGDIVASSVPGEGSVFTVSMPFLHPTLTSMIPDTINPSAHPKHDNSGGEL